MKTKRKQARKLQEDGNFEGAFNLWLEIATETVDPIDYCRVGHAASKLGRWAEAETAYERALDIDPSCSIAMGYMGKLHLDRTDGERTSNLLKAKEWLLKALELKEDPIWEFFLGATYVYLRDVGAAVEAFKKAIELNPKYDEAYMNLGLVTFYDCNDHAKAWGYMMKAIEIDPNYALAYRYLGDFSEDQNPEEAQRWFEKSIEIDPKQPETMFKLAMLVKDKDAPRAIDLLRRAIEVDPNYGEAYQQLAVLLQESDRVVEAEGQLRRSLESNPTDYFSHLYQANNLGLQDRFDEAEEMYRRAVALPDEEGKGYEFFANFLDALSRHDEAEELRKKGLITALRERVRAR